MVLTSKKNFLMITLAMVLLITNIAFVSAADNYTFGVVIAGLRHPYYVAEKRGIENKAEALGVELVILDSNNQAAQELANIEDLIIKEVDMILMTPTDEVTAGAAIEKANEAGIPVITVDRTAEAGDIVTYIGSDNVKMGRMAGDFLAVKLAYQGKVAEIQGISGVSNVRKRSEGFNEAIAKYPGIEIVASQPADFDRAKAMSVTENILMKKPNIDGFFSHNDGMMMGVLEALEASGKLDSIVCVGMDGESDALEAIGEGRLEGTVAQQPELMGNIAVEIGLQYLEGDKDIPKNINVPLVMVTRVGEDNFMAW